MMKLTFTPRRELLNYEWANGKKGWQRPEVNRAVIKQLLERNTLNGFWRCGLFVFFLAASAAATVVASRYHWWLAILPLYVYYFFYGFWVAIAHELQHRTVFGKSFDWLSERFFFLVQVLIWNSPTYARVSHNLHHRYTMVRGFDPETDWPKVITSKWVRDLLLGFLKGILVVGAVKNLALVFHTQIRRTLGHKDWMMRDHCTDDDIAKIRGESLAILLFHAAIITGAIWFRCWEPIVFITLAWHIGANFESLWHLTEHITRCYDVNDQRLCTRSIRVSPFVKLIYWGLDDHVDHHLFPQVPSYNLPKLHRILHPNLPEPRTIINCWREIITIAKEKNVRADNEYVPCKL